MNGLMIELMGIKNTIIIIYLSFLIWTSVNDDTIAFYLNKNSILFKQKMNLLKNN